MSNRRRHAEKNRHSSCPWPTRKKRIADRGGKCWTFSTGFLSADSRAIEMKSPKPSPVTPAIPYPDKMSMRLAEYLLLLASLLLLSACGPLYGQMMKFSEGLKSYEVLRGDPAELKKARNLLVVGPFLNADDEHHMCLPKEGGTFPFTAEIIFISKHNDAQRFAAGFERAGLFETELYLDLYYDRTEETAKRLKRMSASEMQTELNLKQIPELILFGTVRKLEHKIAPLRGVIVDVDYELEFYNPGSGQSTVIAVSVFEMFNEDLNTIIRAIKNSLASAG
jgi:hypothetical protein